MKKEGLDIKLPIYNILLSFYSRHSMTKVFKILYVLCCVVYHIFGGVMVIFIFMYMPAKWQRVKVLYLCQGGYTATIHLCRTVSGHTNQFHCVRCRSRQS